MKIRNIIASLFACAAVFSACVPEVEVEIASLDDVKVEPSYFGLSSKGGEKVVSLTAKADWTATTSADWLTIAPASGKAGEDIKLTVKAVAVPETADQGRQAEIHVKVGESVQIITVKQDVEIPDIPFKAGKYFIVVKPDGVAKVAKPVGSAYGYIYYDDATVNGNNISGTAKHVFTFTEVEGGYTIQDSDGKYYYQKGTYDSFNLDANPVEGSVWTVKSYVAGTWKITNNAVSKWMQYDPNYSSMGSYSSQKGLLPLLIDAENAPEDAPVTTVDATAAEINAAADGDTEYRLTGYITSIAKEDYGNLYIKDATGEVYVYGTLDAEGNSKNFASLGIKAGDIVTVVGPKTSYKDAPQMKNVMVEKHYAVTDKTSKEFLAASDNKEVYYRLSGTVANLKDGDLYGNFDLQDADGSVYVYGLLAGWGGEKKKFQELGIKNGDKVTIVGVRTSYKESPQVGSAFLVSHEAAK
jgi:DNA/RNA endonuclease YhcR with UshA esterase domain